MIVYKIRKKDNEPIASYVKGTPAYHNYDKSGRIFESIGRVRSFITTCLKRKRSVRDWEVVEFDLTVKNVLTVSQTVTSQTLAKMLKDEL